MQGPPGRQLRCGRRPGGEAEDGRGSIPSQCALVVGEDHEGGEGVVRAMSATGQLEAARLVLEVPQEPRQQILVLDVHGELAQVGEQALKLGRSSSAKGQEQVGGGRGAILHASAKKAKENNAL